MKRKKDGLDSTFDTREKEEKAILIEKIKLIGNSILEIVQTNDEEETIGVVNRNEKVDKHYYMKDNKIVIGLSQSANLLNNCCITFNDNSRITLHPGATFNIFSNNTVSKPAHYRLKIGPKQKLEIVTKDSSSIIMEKLECKDVTIKTYDHSRVSIEHVICESSSLNEKGESHIEIESFDYLIKKHKKI